MELAPADAIVLRPQELGGQPAPWLAYWAFYLIVIGIFAHVVAAWLGCKKFIAWWKTSTLRGVTHGRGGGRRSQPRTTSTIP